MIFESGKDKHIYIYKKHIILVGNMEPTKIQQNDILAAAKENNLQAIIILLCTYTVYE